MKKTIVVLACACVFVSFGAVQREIIGELDITYHGTGSFAAQENGKFNGTNFVTITVASTGMHDSLKVRNLKGIPGLTMPHELSVTSLSNRLATMKVSLGSGPTSTVYLVADDLGTLITKQCILNAEAFGDTRLGPIICDPGIFSLYAPTATVRKITASSFVGNLENTEVKPGPVMPPFQIRAGKINTIRVKKYRKYLNHWISQVYAGKLGKLKATSISHIASIDKIKSIQSFNLTGFIQSGIIISNNQAIGYRKGNINRIRTGVVYDCYVLAGVPYITNSVSTNLYYDIVEPIGKIKKVRMVSTVETKLVSKRKLNLGTGYRKTQYGNGTEIWENEKLRNIKIKHLP